MKIKLAIADDHPLIVSSIRNVLDATEHIELCAAYSTGEALITGISLAQPDVLLLDYHLPDQNGAQLARYITYHYPGVKILALTGFDKPALALEMLESGCKGYLQKVNADADIILDAISRVYQGHLYIDSSVSDSYSSQIRNFPKTAEKSHPKLTNRELEVLQAIALELTSNEIADKLYISRKTVENHRTNIMIKCGAKNTVGLIKFAIELKLI